MARLERVGNGLLVDQRTTRRVNEDSTLSHTANLLGVNEMVVVLCEGTMKRDDVGHTQQTVERGLLNALGQRHGIL